VNSPSELYREAWLRSAPVTGGPCRGLYALPVGLGARRRGRSSHSGRARARTDTTFHRLAGAVGLEEVLDDTHAFPQTPDRV
jgi:hypothetical protein